MKALSACLNEDFVALLRREVEMGRFSGVSFQQAMSFLLTDGVLPASSLPVASFLKLEDWARAACEQADLVYTATELKNKTGEILEKVLQGRTVRLVKHGREIAEIRPRRS